MIHNMLKVYEQRINDNNWLSEDTKKKAIIKLRALVLKIGYPEKKSKRFMIFCKLTQKGVFMKMKLKWQRYAPSICSIN